MKNIYITESQFTQLTGKHLLEESVSSVVYHFLPLAAMYNVAREDKMILSVSTRPSDVRMSMGYPYYMSLSRTPSSAVGYQRMRINGSWGGYVVRIEFDGNMLNANFKGGPQNYFTDVNDKNIKHDNDIYAIKSGKKNLIQRTMPRNAKDVPVDDKGKLIIPRGRPPQAGYTNYAMLDRNQMHEYEDRIFSNKPEINGIGKYIKRIDILMKSMPRKDENGTLVLSQIFFILRKYGSKVHLYRNEVSFNSVNVRDKVDPTNERYGEVDLNKFVSFYKNYINADVTGELTQTQKLVISKLIYCAAYVSSYVDNTNLTDVYKRYLTEIGAEEIFDDPFCNHKLQEFTTKFSDKYTRFLTKTLQNEAERNLNGPARKYLNNIFVLYKKLVPEFVEKLGLKTGEGGMSPYRIVSMVSTVYNRKNRQNRMVAENSLKNYFFNILKENAPV